ncbi:transcriptional regulator, RpiR family [Proteiniborus ethanoligenes]|uniref:Transcriptional regulator, RpiR family n=1 Tax=Proteiniborus ethanoligenes TaxID=415015 RepID=A0A1H3NCV8_9FIRM|nr:MurR/RpiR family transcriptional regulator [Proteiniborus ethanoligenes]TAH61723.1 MAG: MurR/RpiR family transcriptional regulator [Gottschalkiaceae bacterium]SDY86039.1 transcriptional regulator, RpiR family [Proteiniborus ethanoligenes]
MDDKKKDLMKVIQMNFTRLSKGQKIIAEYIMSNYDKAAFMTASKLGEVVGVSESTVVRFATSLGFSGYPSLQSALQELIKNKLTTVQRLSMSDNYSNNEVGLKKILRTDMENIKATIDDMNVETFEKVVDSILEARRIYILGLRSSTALADYLGFYLGILVDDVKVVKTGTSDVFEQILRVTKDDLVIGISYPRYSRRTLDVLKYVKGQQCKIVGITDSLVSPIANIADYTLIARSNMLSFVDSLVAPMSLINALIIAIGIREKDNIKKYFNELEIIWKEFNIYDSKDKTSQNDK